MALPSLMTVNNPKMNCHNTLYFNCGPNVTFNLAFYLVFIKYEMSLYD